MYLKTEVFRSLTKEEEVDKYITSTQPWIKTFTSTGTQTWEKCYRRVVELILLTGTFATSQA